MSIKRNTTRPIILVKKGKKHFLSKKNTKKIMSGLRALTKRGKSSISRYSSRSKKKTPLKILENRFKKSFSGCHIKLQEITDPEGYKNTFYTIIDGDTLISEGSIYLKWFNTNTEMYIAKVAKSPRYSGNTIVEKLLQLANQQRINKVILDDASIIHRSDCGFSLALFYLLTKGYRWYAKFGFKISDQSWNKKELDLIANIKTCFVRELSLSPEVKNWIISLKIKGKSFDTMTVGDLFDHISDKKRFTDKEICYIEKIMDSHPVFREWKNRPPETGKMELELYGPLDFLLSQPRHSIAV